MNLIENNPAKVQEIRWQGVKTIKGLPYGNESDDLSRWRSIFLFIIASFCFVALLVSVINLQVVHGGSYSSMSTQNRLEEHVIQPDRGIIYDRNGEKLVINVPSFNLMLDSTVILDDQIDAVLETLSNITEMPKEDLISQYEEALESEALSSRILLSRDISRDEVIQIKSHSDELSGVWIDYSTKRNYIGGVEFSHIIGYTGEASESLVESEENIDSGDIVGREGLESYYDEKFRGEKGYRIIEIDATQNIIAEYVNEGTAPVSGDSLYLTIDASSQRKLYDILKEGVDEFDADSAVAVIENVNTGEIWASVSFPSYDNNLFIGGISGSDYERLITDSSLPMFNRVISAQEPPGSMFKTLVAAAALEEGAITKDTVFNSTGVIYLGSGYPFQEYHQHAYGPLNLIGGIAKSSNIYFCKTMLALGIDNFVPYAEFFGFGSSTGVDLDGEASGRVPSPENKLKLAEVSPWLDPIWYSEGDSCNSAIGQGITSVTPIQMVNWSATIANGGKVLQPRLSHKWINGAEVNNEEFVESNILREGMVSDANLALVREGMRSSAYGPLSVIYPLGRTKVSVAAKTGTAEYGVKNEEGVYLKTHAWVMGFFPYEDPEYSFVFFLEGGGESVNSAILAARFIDWFYESRM